jgi:hypothetical protein
MLVVLANLAPAGETPETTVDELAWLAGTWTSEQRGVAMEEHWTEPRGGIMLGLHRDLPPGKKAFFEFLRIEETPGGLVYHASPRGAPATAFRMIALEKHKVIFENPDHDYPKRILYWLDDEDVLHARIEGDRPEQASEWRWRRAR